ncbi:hypothetical protein HZA96_00620 [Candidatus Woesearchaeota archaeon]|nr:hypothetical protein [Candidatus Woesearchaeota archaeon]
MNEKLFSCNICGINYQEEIYAKQCNEWCKRNNSCNLNIIKHAVKKS